MRYAISRVLESGALRGAICVILLTTILILSACKGGGGGAATTTVLTGSSGSLCLTDEYSYRVELEGQSPAQYGVNPDPLAQAYEGNIGGQIRGVAQMNIALPGEEPENLLLWGRGASVAYGTQEVEAGAILLKKPGAVMDIAPIRHEGKQMLVYGTERGIGIIGPTSSGGLADMAAQGAWRSVPAGVLSLAASEDGGRILFTSKDGFMQQISTAQIIGGESCSGIVATKFFNEAAQEDMVPVKVQLGEGHAFVLSKLASAVTTTAPTFSQVYDPIFKAMAYDGVLSTVSAINLESGAGAEAGYTAEDGSFDRYDRFIPTDITSDGQHLYVVGLAYAQASVAEFQSAKCTIEEFAEDPVECLKNFASNGELADYTGGTSIEKFVAGFFVYRNMEDLSKADHFEVISISNWVDDKDAPPFTYAIGASTERVFVRGANFIVIKHRVGTTSEDWVYDATGDKGNVGLTTGVPNKVVPYLGGAATSFTAVRQSDGSGASELEFTTEPPDSTFSVLDTGAIFVRVDGAGENSRLVAAIEMASYRGGKLYLENAVTREYINVSAGGMFVSRAAYDGAKLAFAWSSTVNESSQHWRIAIQSGFDSSTRGELLIARSGGSAGEFDGFPAVSSSSKDPSKLRGVGGMALSADGKLAVLFSGYSNNKWYHQVGLYKLTKSGDAYEAPKLIGISDTITSNGSSSAHPGSVLAVRKDGTKYETIFSNADSIRSWKITPSESSPPGGTPSKLFGVNQFVDAAMDAQGGSKMAIASGNTIIIKDADNTSADGVAVAVQAREGTSLDRLVGARVAFSGSILALASPYGAAYTFSLYQVGGDSISFVAGTTLTRFFDVKAFRFFPTYLLASSQAGGIEIYDLSN